MISNKSSPPEETLGSWTLSQDSKTDFYLILAARIFLLAILLVNWFFKDSSASSTIDTVFFVLWAATVLVTLSNLQSTLRTHTGYETFSAHFGIVGQTLVGALMITTSCNTTQECVSQFPNTTVRLVQCMSCMKTDGSALDWRNLADSVQLKYSKHGLVLFLCMLGFESRASRVIYSLIPLQVYIVSFPNSSQAEKITGYMCLVSYVLLCLIKMIDVGRKQILKQNKNMKLFKHGLPVKPEAEKLDIETGPTELAKIQLRQSPIKSSLKADLRRRDSEGYQGRQTSILIKKTHFQRTERTSRSHIERSENQAGVVTKIMEQVKMMDREEWVRSTPETPK